MNIVVISGLACPRQKWEQFLSGLSHVKVLSFLDQLKGAENPRDLRSLGRFVGNEIEKGRPDVIIGHDFGVATSVMGLLRIRRKDPQYSPKVIYFNSALRGVNLFKSPHPFKIQVAPWGKIKGIVKRAGGECDPELEKFFPEIKALYRQIILGTTLNAIKAAVGKMDTGKLSIGGSVLVFRSDDDPFFPSETIQKMADTLDNARVVQVNYGHFPYTVPYEKFSSGITSFLR